PDLPKMIERSRQVSNQLASGIKGLLKKHKITHVQGHGRFLDDTTLQVTHEEKKHKVTAKHFIIATGARARELPHIHADGKRIWLAKHAMTAPFLPQKLLVIGSGAIGIEFASFFATLGTHVTVVEMQDRILPQEDKDVSAFAQKQFEKQGMTFHLKSTVSKVESTLADVHVSIIDQNQKPMDATYDAVILAVGIQANIEDLGLENTGIKTLPNGIEVNAYNQTSCPHIYAIGDVAGAPWLAHKASHEGVIVAEHIMGLNPHALNKASIPGCTYSHPQIASLGLTEEQAKAKGLSVNVGTFPLIGNGKAQAVGETEGFVKTIFDEKTGELLGAHMIGHEVTEMIQGFTIAKQLETTEQDLMGTIFPHPTLSEAMHESVLSAYKRAIHY
ncbi:MAG: dihydrolipoyl dehydrogenase, partial [Alphaproteobacteria bacterium]|nr:dihydrolipoyl dehydrogenase [Alphaproteobacteria bacterium]